jgi:transcriptional regulator with XRE-family HTH domain
MSGADGQELLLPKGRTLPINGDVVRTLRTKKRWSLNVLATKSGLSKDRLMEIEKGGQNVYQDSFMAIAQALGLGEDWRPLLDGVDKDRAVAAPSAKRMTRPITISDDFEQFIKENHQAVLIQKLSQAIDALNEIIVHVVRKGSVVLEIEMSEDDWRKFDVAFQEGKLAALGITHVGEVQAHPPVPPKARAIKRFISRIELNPRRFARVAAYAAYAYTVIIAPLILLIAFIDIERQKKIIMDRAVSAINFGPDPYGPVWRQARDWNIIEVAVVLLVICFLYLWKHAKK